MSHYAPIEERQSLKMRKRKESYPWSLSEKAKKPEQGLRLWVPDL